MDAFRDEPPPSCAKLHTWRRLFVAGAIMLGLFAAPGTGSALAGQNPAARVIYSRNPIFRIPFTIDPNGVRLSEVQLYVSEDQGQTWQKAMTVGPEQGSFALRAQHDGSYCFTVRTIDVSGVATPKSVAEMVPQIRICIDTQVPIISIRPAPARDGVVGIEWDIREDNLDVNSVSLEYRPTGTQEFIPLTIDPGQTGQRYWNPGPNSSLEVRVRARDLAKNEGEGRRILGPGGDAHQGGGNYNDPDAGRGASPAQPRGEPRYVSSKRISFNYEIQEKGPSGTSAVELHMTRDGRTWKKVHEDTSCIPPLTYEVEDEGLYGFTLIVRSGVGLSERPPRSGDSPQVWVEVDLRKPEIEFVNAEVDPGPDNGRLTIAWKATDKNLIREPITLSYSKDAEGPWTKIADSLANSGSYVWRMPPSGIPYQFFVQVEAVDKAGNIGKRRTQNLIKVDLKKPRGVILDVTPAGAGGGTKVDSESNKP